RKKAEREGRRAYGCIEQEVEIGMRGLAVRLTDREGTWWGALSLTSHQSRTSLEALCRDHLDLLYSAQAMLVG
ncbi:IclR family transcriptional regulator, partial [Pseudomonas aeruginosa]